MGEIPDWVQNTIDDGRTPVSEGERDMPPTIAQGLAVGDVRNRTIGNATHGDNVILIGQPARVEIVEALDQRTGKMIFRPASNHGHIYPSDLPEVSLVEAGAFNTAEVGGSLRTARKRGAARTHW